MVKLPLAKCTAISGVNFLADYTVLFLFCLKGWLKPAEVKFSFCPKIVKVVPNLLVHVTKIGPKWNSYDIGCSSHQPLDFRLRYFSFRFFQDFHNVSLRKILIENAIQFVNLEELSRKIKLMTIPTCFQMIMKIRISIIFQYTCLLNCFSIVCIFQIPSENSNFFDFAFAFNVNKTFCFLQSNWMQIKE